MHIATYLLSDALASSFKEATYASWFQKSVSDWVKRCSTSQRRSGVLQTSTRHPLCKYFARHGICVATDCQYRHHFLSGVEESESKERAQTALQKQESHLEAEQHPDGNMAYIYRTAACHKNKNVPVHNENIAGLEVRSEAKVRFTLTLVGCCLYH